MLQIFKEFRERLDSIMLNAFGHRIVLWGYGYTGRFLEWYSDYYHSLKVDYIIEDNWPLSMPYEFSLFRSSLFDFQYKDVKDAIVWLAIPETNDISARLREKGYIKGKNYFSFLEVIYENNYINDDTNIDNIFRQRKQGIRDVQFMEWLEYRYNCNFVTAIDSSYFDNKDCGAHKYSVTTQKEIFPILDKCHCLPHDTDAIFDFGCGKGGAIISFLDYGFKKVGGVEFERNIYEVMIDNFKNLKIDMEKTVSCIYGDAKSIKEELDEYNWFYYFDPFDKEIFKKTIKNICDSLKRKPRKVHIININPSYHDIVLNSGYFFLTNQFCISMRQKVVDIFATKKEFEEICM